MFGKLVNDKIQGEVDEDIYVAALERERDWIYLRLDAIRSDVWNDDTPHDSAVCSEYWSLNTRLNYIIMQIGSPDEESLWTNDEVSAQITEEELAKACERLDSATAQAREYGDYLRDNPGSPYLEKERNRWLEIIRKRKEEVLRLENILIDNPKSGWLPF